MLEIAVALGFGLLCWGIARAPQAVLQACLALTWLGLALLAIGSVLAALAGWR